MPFWNFVKNEANPEQVELRIEGEIVSNDDAWIYEWFGIPVATPNAFKAALAEHKGKDINVWIDSWGGDTTAAAGIYNALKEHDGKITVKIDGKAVSAASVIAMAGDEVMMSPVGIMMIHNPWSGIRGEARDMRHMADVLDEVKDTIVNAYQFKSKRSRKKISEMMDEETWMSPKKALAEGFIDGILYSETNEPAIENSFVLSGMAIQNSASKSMARFIEQYNAKQKELLEKGIQDPLNNNPVSQRQPPLFSFSSGANGMNEVCACSNCNHSDNCQAVGAKCCICGNCDLADQCSKPGSNGCKCSDCTMAQTNCCQPGTESCMCDTCPNTDCMKGHMDPSGTMNNKSPVSLFQAQIQVNKNKMRRKANV